MVIRGASRLGSRLGSRGWLSRSLAMALVLKGGGPVGVLTRLFGMPASPLSVPNYRQLMARFQLLTTPASKGPREPLGRGRQHVIMILVGK